MKTFSNDSIPSTQFSLQGVGLYVCPPWTPVDDTCLTCVMKPLIATVVTDEEKRSWKVLQSLQWPHPDLMYPNSVGLLLVYYSSDLFSPQPLSSQRPRPPHPSTHPLVLPSPGRSLSHSLSHALTLGHSLCGAPMVTCCLSKQDKLSTYKSQQCVCPLSLAHPGCQTKNPTRGSHQQPIQTSATLFEVADCCVNPRCFSPAQCLTHSQKQEIRQMCSCDTGRSFLL